MNKRLLSTLMLTLLILSTFTACGSTPASGNDTKNMADTVIIGTICTVDGQDNVVSALAVKDGVYIYVGDEENVQPFIGDTTEVIVLEKGMAMPSFSDGHAHGSLAGFENLYEVDMYACKTVEEMQDAVRVFIEKNPDIKYVTGTGWMNGYFPPTGPTAALLDEVNIDIPIAIISGDHHSVWANSKAMEIANVTAKTPDVEAGVIVRDKNGNPTGCFREKANSLITSNIPNYSVEQCKAAVLAYQKDMVAVGITAYYDPFAAYEKGSDDLNLLKAYEELGKSGDMLIRTFGGYGISANRNPLEEVDKAAKLMKDTASDNFSITSIKSTLDGVVEGRTALLLEDYADEPGFRGEQKWSQDLLNQVCAKADKLGMQLHLHTIGDGATRMGVDAVEFVTKENGPQDRRSILTHLQLADPADAKRMGELNIVASVNFDWHFKEDAYFYELEMPFLGEARANSEYPAKLFFDSGCVVSAASDYPVGLPASPLTQIEIGMTRCNPITNDPATCLNPSQKATLMQMIRSVTINEAYQNFQEEIYGSIEVGKSADLVVLDQNILEIDPFQISDTKVLKTFLRGEVIFSAE